MKNKFIQKALYILIISFAFTSTAFADGKWLVIKNNIMFNLDRYNSIEAMRISCKYQKSGVHLKLVVGSAKATAGDRFITVDDCNHWDDKDAEKRLMKLFEKVTDFLDDDDEFLQLDMSKYHRKDY